MTKQEKNILKQFEKDLEEAMRSYLSSKKGNQLSNGAGTLFLVNQIHPNSLHIPTEDEHYINILLEHIQLPSNTKPALKGYVTLYIKESTEKLYERRTYVFEIFTSNYEVSPMKNMDTELPLRFDITIAQIEYFWETKYRLH